jgi:hypothetical protein
MTTNDPTEGSGRLDEPSTSTDRDASISEVSLSKIRSRRHDLHQAMERLEFAAAGPSHEPEHWLGSVKAAIVGLKDALDAHVHDVEMPDGLFTEVTGRAPRLAGQVEELENEHLELLHACQRVAEALEEEPVADRAKIRRRVISLLGRLTMHRQRGADLVYEAYNVDIGGFG